jgi:hypothetical protein
MNRTRYFMVLGAALLPIALVAFANGCKDKEETMAPVPSATPAPTPTPTPTPVATVVPEEDAGAPDAADAAADAKAAVGVGDPTGIRKCCNAIAQNMKSAPPDQQLAYGAALAACNAAVSSPQGRQALAGVRAALAGAGSPAACQ